MKYKTFDGGVYEVDDTFDGQSVSRFFHYLLLFLYLPAANDFNAYGGEDAKLNEFS